MEVDCLHSIKTWYHISSGEEPGLYTVCADCGYHDWYPGPAPEGVRIIDLDVLDSDFLCACGHAVEDHSDSISLSYCLLCPCREFEAQES